VFGRKITHMQSEKSLKPVCTLVHEAMLNSLGKLLQQPRRRVSFSSNSKQNVIAVKCDDLHINFITKII